MIKASLKQVLEVLPSEYRQRVLDLYYEERPSALHRVVSSCFPWYFPRKCPLCGWRFRRFLSGGVPASILVEKNVIGGGYRSNMVCPHCCSTDRERLVYLYLRTNKWIFSQPVKVLHVAPEAQLQRVLRGRSNIDYLSVDLNSPLAMVKMDLTQVELDSNSFDGIICNHVLEHIPEDGKAISELFRILRPGGWAILQVPVSLALRETLEDSTIADPEERLRLFGQVDHVRIYAACDYRRRLERAGFAVTLWSAASEYGDSFVNRYSLIREEDLHVCKKPDRHDGKLYGQKNAICGSQPD
jgi:predicted SAM-dependent methyltransferase